MKRSKFEELAGYSEPLRNYYGLTQTEWYALTPQERIIHYNRNRPADCDHPFVYRGIAGHVDDDRLLEAQSFDPYANTPHMFPHSVEKYRAGTCDCQTCDGKFGLERDK